MGPRIEDFIKRASQGVDHSEVNIPPIDRHLRRVGSVVVPAMVLLDAGAAEAAAAASEAGQDADSAMGFLVFAPLAAVAAFVVSLVLLRQRQKRDRHHLVNMLLTDGLTGLSNRRRLDTDLESCTAADVPIAVAMIDIDRFKELNDRQGHVVGDDVLQRVAETIATSIRETDVVYRYGGEEFCVLLPGASEENAMQVIERVRRAVEQLDLSDIDETVTVSAGVSSGPGGVVLESLNDADRALYAAKGAGRNKVLIAST